MEKIILVVHILAAAAVIGLVLLQHGKGADMGAAFGSGASGSLFGVSGSSNVLSKLTAVFVAVFFVTSLTLAYLASHRSSNGSVINTGEIPAVDTKGSVQLDASTIPTEVAPAAETAKDIPNE
ncbi:MAG: preprotein translocase subunit SecG [Methylophilaceae bacterium 17-43-7]|jgi:preprotein translocase subunit SecG|nr:MAG: preprotein translocase subunit SecG [Methylophilaceae bacterium 17-43-7]